MKNLQLQEAKAQLSKVIKNVLNSGPCEITVHGKPAVVIVSKEEYDALTKPKESLLDFLQSSPLSEDDLKLIDTRNKTRNRDIDL
jgi:antitoxin Phd